MKPVTEEELMAAWEQVNEAMEREDWAEARRLLPAARKLSERLIRELRAAGRLPRRAP